MAKVKRIQCKGKTKAGKQCQRKAVRDGEYCDVHGGEKELPSWLYETPKQNARAHDGGDLTAAAAVAISSDYAEIMEMCRKHIKSPTKESGMIAQWGRLMLDCIRLAKEEKRLMDGLGAGVQHMFVLEHPKGDKPKPPADNGKQFEDEPERVIH